MYFFVILIIKNSAIAYNNSSFKKTKIYGLFRGFKIFSFEEVSLVISVLNNFRRPENLGPKTLLLF